MGEENEEVETGMGPGISPEPGGVDADAASVSTPQAVEPEEEKTGIKRLEVHMEENAKKFTLATESQGGFANTDRITFYATHGGDLTILSQELKRAGIFAFETGSSNGRTVYMERPAYPKIAYGTEEDPAVTHARDNFDIFRDWLVENFNRISS